MLFYPARRGNAPVFGSRQRTFRPLVTAEAGDAMHLTWMLRSFIMGITLLGLSYWLVQIAGIQYLASLTSGTLLFFLLAYVVWCLLHRNRNPQQTPDGTSRMETGNISPVAGAVETLTPTPPPPFDQHQAYKFLSAPPRDSSPPPSYDEAVRAMTVTAISNTRDWHHTSGSLEPVPAPVQASLTPRPYSGARKSSSPSALSQSSAFASSPTLALSLSSSTALTPDDETAPVTQTLSALAQQSVPQTQQASTPQLSAALAQTSQTASAPSRLSSTPSQQMEEVS